jgi:hypothetical protein
MLWYWNIIFFKAFHIYDNDFILSIFKVLIAKHLDAAILTIFDPSFRGIDTTYKILSLHVKSIYQMFSNQYFEDREDKIIIFREKLWYLSRTNMPLLRQ